MKTATLITGLLCCLHTTALAGVLDVPETARPLSDEVEVNAIYALPVGPFQNGSVATRSFEGEVSRQSWQLGDGQTLDLVQDIRTQLLSADYDVLLDCADRVCGGFDFRFAVEVLPTPTMIVNIGDFHFLSAENEDGDAVSALVSRAGDRLYLQLISVSQHQTQPAIVRPAPRPPKPDVVAQPQSDIDLIARLLANGHVVLDDLVFATGSSQLEDKAYDSLRLLSVFLTDNTTYGVALVGHTDNVGTLDDNIALSTRRANAVREMLVSKYDLSADRLEATGVGYLAPLASNLNAEGRAENRRVEAVLFSQ